MVVRREPNIMSLARVGTKQNSRQARVESGHLTEKRSIISSTLRAAADGARASREDTTGSLPRKGRAGIQKALKTDTLPPVAQTGRVFGRTKFEHLHARDRRRKGRPCRRLIILSLTVLCVCVRPCVCGVAYSSALPLACQECNRNGSIPHRRAGRARPGTVT